MSKSLFIIAALLSGLFLYSCSSTSSDSVTKFQVTLSSSPAEGGSVSPASGEHEEGKTLEISATANDGWRFVEWAGDYSGTQSTTTITVDGDKNITAVYEKKSYALTINTDGSGTVEEKVVTSKTTEYEHGTLVELTANPATGWKFVEWQGDVTGTDNPIQLTVDEAKDVTAIFEKKSYALTVNKTGQGSVDEAIVQNKSTDYNYGTTVELTANPATGWIFVEWQGDLTGSTNPQQITVDNPKDVTTVFEKESFALTLSTTGQGSIAKNPDQQEYEYDTTVDLTASAATGWEFVEWQGDVTGTDNPVQLTVDEAKSVTAIFEKKSFVLTITTTGQGAIVKNPDQATYEYGTIVELTANADNGWEFSGWQGDVSSNSNFIELTIDSPTELTAVFTEETAPLFYLAENGVTIKCEDAQIGDSGDVNGITYTKRSASDIYPVNANEVAATSCTSGITDMNKLFYRANDFNADISSWDVSSVRDMSRMFDVVHDFNADLSSWDVSRVTNMYRMFWEARSFNGNISSWDVSSVTNMHEMFAHAIAFNGDISGWNVGSVKNMGRMFYYAKAFNGDISSWDVSGVTTLRETFKEAEAFNADLSNWNVSNVTTLYQTFVGASAFNSDLNSWDVSNVTVMRATFSGASSFNGDISDWVVSKVSSMRGMFGGTEAFNRDIGSWDVSNVTNMQYMFSEATAFNQNLGGWNIPKGTNMFGMFWGASSFNGYINNWDVSHVQNMDKMFLNATVFNQNLSGWCVSQFEFPHIPSGFSLHSALIPEHLPVWGTCPGGN
jgi:surface protein